MLKSVLPAKYMVRVEKVPSTTDTTSVREGEMRGGVGVVGVRKPGASRIQVRLNMWVPATSQRVYLSLSLFDFHIPLQIS